MMKFSITRKQALLMLLFLMTLTILFLCFCTAGEFLYTLYGSAIAAFVFVGFSFLRFGLAFLVGSPLGLLIGYHIGKAISHFGTYQDGWGMAPNLIDEFIPIYGSYYGICALLMISSIELNLWKKMKKTNNPFAKYIKRKLILITVIIGLTIMYSAYPIVAGALNFGNKTGTVIYVFDYYKNLYTIAHGMTHHGSQEKGGNN